MKNKEIRPKSYSNLFDRIANVLVEARTKAVREINKAQVLAYWEIGREIVDFEQKGKARAEYGEELIKRLSEDMTEKFGKGFSEMNLRNMRRFYLEFPIQIQQTLSVKSQKFETPPEKSEILSRKSTIPQTASGKFQISRMLSDEFEPMLSWSHYCELLKVEEHLARSFYEQETVQNNWSVRELKRQINSMLFERLALSKDTKAVIKMARKGQIVEKPEDGNDPIGIILCAKKDDIFAKYVLGGLSNKVFASKYKLALPSEKELRLKLKSIPRMLEDKH
jgi:hypothetical protein